MDWLLHTITAVFILQSIFVPPPPFRIKRLFFILLHQPFPPRFACNYKMSKFLLLNSPSVRLLVKTNLNLYKKEIKPSWFSHGQANTCENDVQLCSQVCLDIRKRAWLFSYLILTSKIKLVLIMLSSLIKVPHEWMSQVWDKLVECFLNILNI